MCSIVRAVNLRGACYLLEEGLNYEWLAEGRNAGLWQRKVAQVGDRYPLPISRQQVGCNRKMQSCRMDHSSQRPVRWVGTRRLDNGRVQG
jgi:hypothetical protein